MSVPALSGAGLCCSLDGLGVDDAEHGESYSLVGLLITFDKEFEVTCREFLLHEKLTKFRPTNDSFIIPMKFHVAPPFLMSDIIIYHTQPRLSSSQTNPTSPNTAYAISLGNIKKTGKSNIYLFFNTFK